MKQAADAMCIGARSVSAVLVHDGNQKTRTAFSERPIMAKRVSKGKGESENDSPARRKVSKAETFAAVQTEFLQILKQRPTGTVDLIHKRLDIPPDAKPRIGRAIADLCRQGLIVKVEFQPTLRGVAHGRNVFVWRLFR